MTATAEWDWPRLQRDLVAREHLMAALPSSRARIRCATLAIERVAPWWEQALLAARAPQRFSGFPRRLAADVRAFIREDLPEQPEGVAALAAWAFQAREMLDEIRLGRDPENLPEHLLQRLWWPLYYFIECVYIWGRHAVPDVPAVTSLARAVAATVWQAGVAISEYRAMSRLDVTRRTAAVEDVADGMLEEFVLSTWRDCQR